MEQTKAEHLVEEPRSYLLKPDFLLEKEKKRVVADAKWKNIYSRDSVEQSDLYQLFAYSEKYLRKAGDPQHSFLVYPQTDSFQSSLEFQFYVNTAILKAVPFDLENDACELFTELTN